MFFMKGKLVRWNLSRGWELFGIFGMLATLMALFQEVNLLFLAGLSWKFHLVGSIEASGLWAFWITLALFIAFSLFVISRSVMIEGRNKTSNGFDYVWGFLTVFGVYLVLTGTIYFLYKGIPEVEFLGGVSYLFLVKMGFALIGLSTLWFGITE